MDVVSRNEKLIRTELVETFMEKVTRSMWRRSSFMLSLNIELKYHTSSIR